MTLLTLVQGVCRATGLRVPTTVVDSTDTQVLQLYALANESGADLARSADWQALTRQWTFITVAAEEQTDAIPDDVQSLIYNSFWDRTTRLQVLGPVTPQLWQAMQAMPQINRVYLGFRERDNVFLMTPTPAAGHTIAYEYVSSYWAKAANGDAKAEFTADNDTSYLSEYLIGLSLRWRFLSAKNLDYAEAFRSYETELQQQQARDGGSTMLRLGSSAYWNPLGYPPFQVALGNWPG